MTLPDQLTLARALAVPVVIVLFAWDFQDHLYWATAVFVVAMATDQVDGWLARRRNQTSAFGSLLDPIADKVLVLAALVMLVAEGVAPAWMVAAIVAREIAVSGLRLAAIERGVVMGARDLGKLKTWAQTVAAILAGLAGGRRVGRRRGVVGAARRDAADVDLGARLRAGRAARPARRASGLVGRRPRRNRQARARAPRPDLRATRAETARPASGSATVERPAHRFSLGRARLGNQLDAHGRDPISRQSGSSRAAVALNDATTDVALAEPEALRRPRRHLGGQRADAQPHAVPELDRATRSAPARGSAAVSVGVSRAIETSHG